MLKTKTKLYPLCHCTSINKQGAIRKGKITTCTDGSTCDGCGHFVLWATLQTERRCPVASAARERATSNASYLEEYRVGQ